MKTYQIFKSYNELPKAWDDLVQHDIFLQSEYLKALEKASPNNIQLYYLGIFENQELIGVTIIQCVQLYLKNMFRQTKISCFKEFIRTGFSKILKGNILVVGNLTHTGQHGIFFNAEKLSYSEYLSIVLEALETLKVEVKNTKHKTIRAIMFKDFFQDDPIHTETAFFKGQNIHKVTVQPNMLMDVKPNWVTSEDYVKNFNKKYRDRYKRARNKLKNTSCSEMDAETIKIHSTKLHELYLNVSNNAKFNTFLLPENHFFSLKRHLKDQFKVFGYYSNHQLIGFFTLILNGKHLETYFLGYDSEHQHSNQLYLNMLYDMAKFGIDSGFSQVVYARTAMEIKSSVGAKPKPMFVYIKHTNKILNALLKQVFALMNPTQTWEERHPFT